MSQMGEVREKSKKGILIVLALIGLILWLIVLGLRQPKALAMAGNGEGGVLVVGSQKQAFSNEYTLWAVALDSQGEKLWEQNYKEKFHPINLNQVSASFSEGWNIQIEDSLWILDPKGKVENDPSPLAVTIEDTGDPSVLVEENPIEITERVLELEYTATEGFYAGDTFQFSIIEEGTPYLYGTMDESFTWERSLNKELNFMGKEPQDFHLWVDEQGLPRISCTMVAYKADIEADRPRPYRFNAAFTVKGQILADSIVRESLESYVLQERDTYGDQDYDTYSDESWFYGIYSYEFGEWEYHFDDGVLYAEDNRGNSWEERVYLPLDEIVEGFF